MTDDELWIHIRSLNSTLHSSGDAEYKALSERYIEALASQGVPFQSPGPGSPTRWIIHGIEYKIAPHLWRPSDYHFDRIGEKAGVALSALAALFEERLPAFAEEWSIAQKRRARCIGWHLRSKNALLRPFDSDAIFITDQNGSEIGCFKTKLAWPEGPFADVAELFYEIASNQNSLLRASIGSNRDNWVIVIDKPLRESPLSKFGFTLQEDGSWLLQGQFPVCVLEVPRVGFDGKTGAMIAQRFWQERLKQEG